jgi:hypothetical protein
VLPRPSTNDKTSYAVRGAFAMSVLAVGSGAALLDACKDAPDRRQTLGEASASASASAASTSTSIDDGAASLSAEEEDAGRVARLVEAQASAARGDAGPIDRACESGANAALGATLLASAADPRCALGAREWGLLTPDAGTDRLGLRQEALREGDQIVLALVNRGSAPLDVPVRFRVDQLNATFTVLAEDECHAVFELAAPAPTTERARLERPIEDAGPRRPARDQAPRHGNVHSARIRLLPGGSVRERLVLDTKIVRHLGGGSGCVAVAHDGGGTVPTTTMLPKGRYILHVGQLMTGIDAGLPARVPWEIR